MFCPQQIVSIGYQTPYILRLFCGRALLHANHMHQLNIINAIKFYADNVFMKADC